MSDSVQSEKTRVLNFLKKEAEVDKTDIREVATAYKELSEIEEVLKSEKKKLEPLLEKAHVDERFEDGKKVQFQEGKSKSSIDVNGLFKEMGEKRFLKVAKVSASDLSKETDGKLLLAKYQKTLPEKTKGSVVCRKMNLQELKEYQSK